MSQIIFNDVEVTYLGKGKVEIPALKKFSCSFVPGKVNVLTGYSGCGKTTVLRALTSQVNYGGSITFNGLELAETNTARDNISLVQQEYALYPHMTIFDNLAFPLKMQKYSPSEITKRVKEVADFLGLSYLLARKPKELSGGQQQRVALGRALLKRPDTILFDEPISNVDEANRIRILKTIHELSCVYSTTVILVTHNIREAFSIADRFFVMDDGKLTFEGSPDDILHSDNKVVVSLLQGTFG